MSFGSGSIRHRWHGAFGNTGFGLLCLGTVVHAQQEPLRGLDSYITRSMRESQVPGLAIAVVWKDSVVYLRGFGVREAGKPALVDPETVFALSSNSKAFGAAAVGILVDEGKLSWDDPIIKHLPGFQLPDPWVTRAATLRDLLSHRLAGDIGSSGAGWLWSMTPQSDDEVLRNLRHLEIGRYRFRDRFEYNNPNLMVAAKVVAAVSGMDWRAFMKARVFDPLEMTSATTSVRDLWDPADLPPCYFCEIPSGRVPGHERARIPNIVMPHMPTDTGTRPIRWSPVDNIGPAGAVNANVVDVARFIRVHLAKGKYQGRRVFSEAVIEEMHSPQMLITGRPPYRGGPGFGHFWAYGLGWFLTDYHGRRMVLHTGAIPGFHSGIVLLPDEQLGVGVLTNSESGEPVALALSVFDRYLKLPQRDWIAEWRAAAKATAERNRAAENELISQRIDGTRPSHPASDLVGEYTHPAFGRLEVLDRAGSLVVRLAGNLSGDLVHWHHEIYRVTWKSPSRYIPRGFVTVGTDGSGRVSKLEFNEPLRMGVFTRSSAPRSSW